MIAADLISEATAAGLCLQAVGNDRLKCTSKGPPPPDLLARLRDRKVDLIAALRAEDHRGHRDLSVDGARRWREAFEERAAIREHRGGLSRVEAEAAALNDLASVWRSENPLPASDSAACYHCGKLDPCRPHLAANGHVWLHEQCWEPLNAAREKLAREAINRALRTATAIAPKTTDAARGGGDASS
ncbi:MAG: hypothetical protein ABMA14_12875 [Hyphomonadaceae bacterium]